MAGSRKTCTGGYITPKILVEEDMNKDKRMIVVGNTVPSEHTAGRVFHTDGISPTVMERHSKVVQILESELYNTYKLIKSEKESYDMEKLRVFEAFCGYGSQSVALENIGVPHEVVAISDIDADVLISYGAIRGDITQEVDKTDDEIKEWLMARNIGWDFQKQKSSIPRMKKDKLHKLYNSCMQHNCLGDVSIIDPNTIPDHDLFTYSFPCTDISVAGKQAGLSKDSGTRSGLLWECEKIIAVKKPKYLLMENVKNLVGKKFKDEFDVWCDWLSSQGYKNFYQVLNAKDYGIPQNRERVFMISILDENATYEFPKRFPLELRLKDILEDVVDDKYYIDNDASNRLLNQLKDKNSIILDMCQAKREGKPREYSDVSPCLSARDYKEPRLVNESSDKIVCEQRCDEGLRFFKGDVCGTIRTIEAGGDKRVIEKTNATMECADCGCVFNMMECCPRCRSKNITVKKETNKASENSNGLVLYDNLSGGKWDKIHESARRVYDEQGVAPTIPTCQGGNIEPKAYSNYRIRKLTPMECWRLMGMKDEHFLRCAYTGLSNSQLYKQAGNSIVVDVLEYIFRELFKEYIVSENFTQPQEN